MSEVQDTCFPLSHREASFTVAALHQWSHTEPPVLDTRCVTTAEEWINEVIHPHSPGGPLPCVSIPNTSDRFSMLNLCYLSSYNLQQKRQCLRSMAKITNVCKDSNELWTLPTFSVMQCGHETMRLEKRDVRV